MNQETRQSRQMRKKQAITNDRKEGAAQQRVRPQKPTKSKRQKSWKQKLWNAWCVLFLVIFIGSLISGSFLMIFYFDIKNDMPGLDIKKIESQEASIVVDKTGNTVANLAQDELKMVTYNELPQSLIDAFTAIEDARFFRHKGIDGARTVKAVFGTFIARSGSSGGSTLTQQLIKQTVLAEKRAKIKDYHKSTRRKIDEWLLAYELEKEMSKQDILVAYLNNAVNYGRFTGVGTAAKQYFNKNISELTLPEAALLAGIPQLPAENNPFYDIETSTKRYHEVLNAMYEVHHYITEEEYNAAKAIPLADLVIRNQDELLSPNSAYFSAVETELNEIFGEEQPDEGMPNYYKNLRIYTELVPEQQEFANQIMNTTDYVDWDDAVYNTYGSGASADENLNFQGAFAVVSVQDGGIPAIGASRNFKSYGQNIAINGYRSPGSSIKPIIDYAPAVEKFGWGANHVMNDKTTYYSGTRSEVYNFSGGHKGFISMQKAISDSVNTTAVQAMQAVGIEESATMATNMGITKALPLYQKGNLGEASALGGGLEVTPKELASAYATLGNAGKYNKPHTITKIEYIDDGSVLWQYVPEQRQVMKESTAATMTDSLLYTRYNGTPASGGRKQVSSSIKFGAKTGTSSYSGEELSAYGISRSAEKDHWIAGYSPEYAIAAWTGLAVEDAKTLEKTKGNTNSNKSVGSYMMAAWMNKFSPAGTDFSFLGAANKDKQGSIGDFVITNDTSNRAVSWTIPEISYPNGLTDEEKASFGELSFEASLTGPNGTVGLGIASNSASYADLISNSGTYTITVTAKLNSENAALIMEPKSLSVSFEVNNTPASSNNNSSNNSSSNNNSSNNNSSNNTNSTRNNT